MAALSESNSPKTRPMRLVACSDGASAKFIATLWVRPSSSSCRTKAFVVAASASHNTRIGTESRRLVRGRNGRAA